MTNDDIQAMYEAKFRTWIGAEQFETIYRTVEQQVRKDVLLSVIQQLNHNPYSLTKRECIFLIAEMRSEKP